MILIFLISVVMINGTPHQAGVLEEVLAGQQVLGADVEEAAASAAAAAAAAVAW